MCNRHRLRSQPCLKCERLNVLLASRWSVARKERNREAAQLFCTKDSHKHLCYAGDLCKNHAEVWKTQRRVQATALTHAVGDRQHRWLGHDLRLRLQPRAMVDGRLSDDRLDSRSEEDNSGLILRRAAVSYRDAYAGFGKQQRLLVVALQRQRPLEHD